MPTEHNISRRSFLRNAAGAMLALPWMESLAAVGSGPPTRFAVYYIPIGVVRRGFFPGEGETPLVKFAGAGTKKLHGARMTTGSHPLALTPTLTPLTDVQSKLSLITGMDRQFQQGTDVHAQCGSCFLTSAAPHEIATSAWPLDRTLDHIIGDTIGHQTPFRTLEFSCNSHRDNKESIYFDNISWYGTGHVAPSMRRPRHIYDRLFGLKSVGSTREITDLVLEDARSLKPQLGGSDRNKFDEYFESVRSIETRMGRLEKMEAELAELRIKEPGASHMPRGEYVKLMGDFMVTALQSGLTNVATFMIGPERWDTAMTYEGLFDKPVSHHQMSHNPANSVDKLLKLDHFHIEQFAYILQKMDAIIEKDGRTLLDNTVITAGSGLGDGSTHQYNDLPIIVAGGKGTFKQGVHLNLADGTPLANLWLTQARAMGVPCERFADSTGALPQILA